MSARHPVRLPRRTTDEMRPDLQNASDANLVMAIARFHKDAIAEVYRRHAGAIFGLAKRVLWDAALAEDVVQEVFLRLWSAPERFDPERGSRRSFLLAQTHGRAVVAAQPSGQAYWITTGALQPLRADQTYQLWAEVHGRIVSIGLLGRAPTDVPS
ncbi:MAG: sigma factor [Acidimicrobiales bacterium]